MRDMTLIVLSRPLFLTAHTTVSNGFYDASTIEANLPRLMRVELDEGRRSRARAT